MTRLNRIQSEISQLEGGRFQQLCDSYLYLKKNWENIHSLGSMEGTDKTTVGIPDTYYVDKNSNKYILVMFGTRKDAVSKLEKDIKDAIEKSKLDKNEIKEIICCHTSSNVPLKKDKELRKLAGKIELTLIGIDTLSHDLLQFKYQNITKNFLGINETTEQVWKINQFISVHDKSRTNAPLNTTYIDEFNKIDELRDTLTNNQILLLSGSPGAGKTRLAIELCGKLSEDINVICVKSNSMPVYQDIKDALDESRLNYLLLDDANTITNFDAVVNLLMLEEYEHNLKIIITVRDYAAREISNQLESFRVKTFKLSLLEDSQIKSLIKNINEELSSEDITKIIKLSHNNPRIAVIGATMMKEKNNDFMSNGKDILESYYSQIIKDNNLTEDDKICLFILSFTNKIELSDSGCLSIILKIFKLDFNKFSYVLHRLHDIELCDIYQNKAAKVSDQNLADYLIIDFILNNRKIQIRDFFISLYPKYSNSIIEMLSIVSTFNPSNNIWNEYLTGEIKYVYEDIIKKDDEEIFLSQFSSIIPNESLAYVYDRILQKETIEFKTSQKEFEEKKRHISVEDPIIKILCSLSDSGRFDNSGILIMKYLQKRPDKLYEVFSAIKTSFNIDISWGSYLKKRFSIVDIFSKQKNINETTAMLIINILDDFLKFSIETVTFDGKKGAFRRYQLVDGDYLIDHHKNIFNIMAEIYELNFKEINNYIDFLILNYPIHEYQNGFMKTVISDLNCIKNLFFKDLKKLNKRQETIVSTLNFGITKLEIKENPFSTYVPSKEQKLYELFSSDGIDYTSQDFDYDSSQKIRISKLVKSFKENANNLFEFFSILNIYQSDELLNKYEIEDSMYLLYLEIDTINKKSMLIAMININFTVSNKYMYMLSSKDGEEVLNNVIGNVDKSLILSNMLTSKKNISAVQVENMESFLKKLIDSKTLSYFNILDFEHFIKKDKKIMNIFFNKYNNNELLSTFFIPEVLNENMYIKIIELVGTEKIKSIYLNCLGNESIDSSGKLFNCLIKEDKQQFLYTFLLKLNNLRIHGYTMQLRYIQNSPKIAEAVNKYLDYLIQEKKLFFIGIDSILEDILESNIEWATEFIIKEIIDTNNEDRLANLYNLSVELFNSEILLRLFSLLKDKEISNNFFEKLHLVAHSKNWDGSLVPLLDQELDFLNKLLSIFNDINHIPYSLIISKNIDIIKKQKVKELLSEYLE